MGSVPSTYFFAATPMKERHGMKLQLQVEATNTSVTRVDVNVEVS